MTIPYARKSIYDLSPNEVERLRNAFRSLYEEPIAPNQQLVSKSANRYQELANILITQGHYQRNDLLFLPWARAYFYEFEQALRSIDAKVSLPYWDYTSAQAITDGIPSILADETYSVNGQSLANPLFKARYKFPLQTFRDVSDSTKPLLAAVPVREEAMTRDNFVDFSLSIYPVDIISHVYIGGSSKDTNTAAYDPIFWFTHCQLDHMWYQWQQGNTNQQVPNSVLSASLKPFVQQVGDQMSFLTGADVMDTESLGYVYE